MKIERLKIVLIVPVHYGMFMIITNQWLAAPKCRKIAVFVSFLIARTGMSNGVQ